MRPRLLDLFCAAGGAAMGYHRAGFDVVGVDINPQPHYPFEFIEANALSLPHFVVAGFNALHASPPCQKYTRKAAHWGRERKHFVEHPDLIEPTRAMLKASGLPYVLENVMGAPMRADGRCDGRPCRPLLPADEGRTMNYEAWRPALIAFYQRDELRQKALNLKNGDALDYLDRRAIEALAAAAELVPIAA